MCVCVSIVMCVCITQHDIYTGIAGEKLLSAVLDALSDPSTSYIGLSYESTVSLSTGQMCSSITVRNKAIVISAVICHVPHNGDLSFYNM